MLKTQFQMAAENPDNDEVGTKIVPTIVNLWGGPGSGKSTAAAGLFFEMKHVGLRVELIHEVARDLMNAQEWGRMDNQLHILSEQDRLLRNAVNSERYDYIISDSPLPMTIAYAKDVFKGDWYSQAAMELFNTYLNVNFWIKRKYCRNGDVLRAKRLDSALLDILETWGVPHAIVEDSNVAPIDIISALGLAYYWSPDAGS